MWGSLSKVNTLPHLTRSLTVRLNKDVSKEQYHTLCARFAPTTSHYSRKDRIVQHSMNTFVPSKNFTGGAGGGFFQELVGESFWSIELSRNFFLYFHDNIGMPWWSCLLTGAITVKLCQIPFSLYSAYNNVKVAKLLPKTQAISREVNLEFSRFVSNNIMDTWTRRQLYVNTMRKVVYEKCCDEFEKTKCGPTIPVVLLYIQLPVFLSFSFGVRSLAGVFNTDPGGKSFHRSDMASEGILWFQNLCVPDPYCILPVFLVLSSITIAEMNYLLRPAGTYSMGQLVFTRFVQGLSMIFLPFSIYFPAALSLYLTAFSTMVFVQSVAFKIPKFRRFVGLPVSSLDIPKPFSYFIREFKETYLVRKKKPQKPRVQPYDIRKKSK